MPQSRPRAELSGAIWTPLGVRTHKSEVWYYLRVGHEVKGYRPSQALGHAFLLSIYPDFEFWRGQFPSRYWHGQRIDTQRACWYILQQCKNAGEYVGDE